MRSIVQKSFRVTSTLLCENVLRMENGSYVLVGVFGPAFHMAEMFKRLIVCVYIEIDHIRFSTLEIEVRFIQGHQVLTTNKWVWQWKDDSPLPHTDSIVVRPVVLKLQRAGKLRIQIRPEGQALWQTVKTFEVKAEPPALAVTNSVPHASA